MGPRRPRTVVLDAGALILFDRGDARLRALVRLAREEGGQLVIPAGVVGQVWRDGARQARLSALLRTDGTEVVPLDEPRARAAGVLCGRAGTADVIDATVALTARDHMAVVVTSDPDDLRRLDATIEVHVV